jgi:adenylate cyclase
VSISLASIGRCFEGTIPAVIATSSASGEPNLAHLSQVFMVDAEHVATSNQFFAKTSANLAVNPLAVLLCPDPVDLVTYKLLVQHERTDTEGSLFESAGASIDAIAALTGMVDVFSLRAIDVFRVLDVSVAAARGPRPT